MILIRSDYGEGGAGIGTKSAQHERIGPVLRGLVSDIATRTPAAIASPDATDLASAITLTNEIKASLNAATGASLEVGLANA
jgi:hypothetical protein